ncbi:penicillin-binding protein 1A [Sphingosinicella rhizophila]|uniref:Penicillin-binding protein 1A n=1 Tax=Sphingosinicella rhizophila TaxID=3050082 RepID=A0ABU3Q6N6_9SPHN|nr:PBP1A family penicillin-binding protein [Sphingosinicella sp. GR2756]MDT9599055.1 PBP1A family penicillin-binding protein [Sphingosinicella sp. GR2756]
MTANTSSSNRFVLRRDAGRFREDVRRAWQKRWVKILALLAALPILGIFFLWLIFAQALPSAESLLTYQPPLPTNVRGADGEPVQTFARERRVELKFDEYPPQLINAFLAAEDRTFFRHGGIDYPGVIGAVGDYISKMGSGERARGGSTITQQVAKNLLLGDEYSVTRKIKEAFLARRIESVLTKEQILELYLNQIFLGRNAYGVQAAARAYFDKDVQDLELPEMAYLAVLPKAPSNYSPERYPERALERRNWVLSEMERNGFITPAQRAAATAAPLGTGRGASNSVRNFGGYFIEEVRRTLIDRYGQQTEKGPNGVYTGGLWVRTSLDVAKQRAAENALRDGLTRYDRGKGWRDPGLSVKLSGDWRSELARAPFGTGYPDWRAAAILSKSATSATIGFADGSTAILPSSAASMPKRGTSTPAFNTFRPGMIIVVKREGNGYVLRSIPEVSGGMVVEEVATGRILAMQGGFDSRGDDFNRATQALRQPGSTFKPVVYSAAMDNGLTPASIIVDGPFCVWQGAGLGNKCFRNFSGGNAGPQTMRWGVEQSRNLMTVRTANQIGMQNVTKLAKTLGVGEYPNYLAIALGAGDTTVMKITNAFAILANNGKEVKPTLIDYVQDRSGKVIYRADTRPCEGCNAPDWNGKPMPRPPLRTKQLMDPMTAYQMVHILEGVVQRGTATTLRELNRPLFGKTGTTSGPTNVWFIGGSPDIVAGIYMGFDQPRPMGGYAQGGTLAAPVFKQFALTAFKDMPVVPFRAPEGIRMVRIDRRSGRKVFGEWPGTDPKAAVIWEAFKPESEPRRSIRREEMAENAAAAKAARSATRTRAERRRDSDFLQNQGGIY